MKSLGIFKRAIHFGSFEARENFVSFALKCIFYIVPAIILGNYTDVMIQGVKKDNDLGDHVVNYILLQTLVNISTLYLAILFLTKYTNEFQLTIAGGFFSVLYFGMQPNYIYMLQEYMNT